MIEQNVFGQEEQAVFALRSLYRTYGYSHYRMSKFEEYDLYVQNKNFLVSDRVITFNDVNGRLLALKPDVTLSIVKNATPPKGGVQKLYYNENVYRTTQGAVGYREIMQVGLECLGAIDDACICEVLCLAEQSLACLGEQTQLCVSHMGILSEVMEAVGFGAKERAPLLRCVAEKNTHGILQLGQQCGKTQKQIQPLLDLVECYGAPAKVLPALKQVMPTQKAKQMLCDFAAILEAVDRERLWVDFSVVQDASYYNGIVFCGFLAGVPERILSGGQYDYLTARMGKDMGALGFALYLDLLKGCNKEPTRYDVDAVLLYDKTEDICAVSACANELRAKGLCVLTQPTPPEKIRYRQLYQCKKGECVCLEANA